MFTGKVKKITKDIIYVTTKHMSDHDFMTVRKVEIVETPEEADIVFSLDKGITPFDYIELEKWM